MSEQELNPNDLESMSGGLIVQTSDGYYIVDYAQNGCINEKADTLDEAKQKAREWHVSTNVVSQKQYEEWFGEFHPRN